MKDLLSYLRLNNCLSIDYSDHVTIAIQQQSTNDILPLGIVSTSQSQELISFFKQKYNLNDFRIISIPFQKWSALDPSSSASTPTTIPDIWISLKTTQNHLQQSIHEYYTQLHQLYDDDSTINASWPVDCQDYFKTLSSCCSTSDSMLYDCMVHQSDDDSNNTEHLQTVQEELETQIESLQPQIESQHDLIDHQEDIESSSSHTEFESQQVPQIEVHNDALQSDQSQSLQLIEPQVEDCSNEIQEATLEHSEVLIQHLESDSQDIESAVVDCSIQIHQVPVLQEDHHPLEGLESQETILPSAQDHQAQIVSTHLLGSFVQKSSLVKTRRKNKNSIRN